MIIIPVQQHVTIIIPFHLHATIMDRRHMAMTMIVPYPRLLARLPDLLMCHQEILHLHLNLIFRNTPLPASKWRLVPSPLLLYLRSNKLLCPQDKILGRHKRPHLNQPRKK
jgi:hypothetical protein